MMDIWQRSALNFEQRLSGS